MAHKFNPKMIDKLDNPKRKEILPPNLVVEKSGVQKDMIILDVGCGVGYFTFPLARVVGETGKVYGLDILPEMLKEAEKRKNSQPEGELDNIIFIQSGENSFPLEDASAHLVFLANVFHEVDSPSAFLNEVKRVLKTKGQIVIVDWKKAETEMGPPVTERLSDEEIINYLKEAGFQQWEALEIPPAHTLVKGWL